MLNFLKDKFTDPESKNLFKDSEKRYNQKIMEKFLKVTPENVDNPDLYNSFFKSFAAVSKENSKLFSKLKHE